MTVPRLAEVKCQHIQFQPGDRIIVRVFHSLNKDEKKKLRRTIQQWAGVEVAVLIVDATEMEVRIEKSKTFLFGD